MNNNCLKNFHPNRFDIGKSWHMIHSDSDGDKNPCQVHHKKQNDILIIKFYKRL